MKFIGYSENHSFWKDRNPASFVQMEQISILLREGISRNKFTRKYSEAFDDKERYILPVNHEDNWVFHVLIANKQYQYIISVEAPDGTRYYFGNPRHPFIEGFLGILPFEKWHTIVCGDEDYKDLGCDWCGRTLKEIAIVLADIPEDVRKKKEWEIFPKTIWGRQQKLLAHVDFNPEGTKCVLCKYGL